MARKDCSDIHSSYIKAELAGILIIGVAIIIALAIFSFNKNDLPCNLSSPSKQIHNLAGPIGAYIGGALFFIFGGGAVLIPVVVLILGLSFIHPVLQKLRKTWIGWLSLLFSVCASLDWATDHTIMSSQISSHQMGIFERLALELGAPSAGGYAGRVITIPLTYLGKVGSGVVITISLIISFYLVSGYRLWFGIWNGVIIVSKWLKYQFQRFLNKLNPTFLSSSLLDNPKSEHKPATFKSPPLSPRIYDFLESYISKAKKPNPMQDEEVLKAPTHTISPEASSTRQEHSIAKKPDKKLSSPEKKQTLPIIKDYKLPTLNLLDPFKPPLIEKEESKLDLLTKAQIIQHTLAEFGIQVTLGDITRGPTITRYELYPAPGIKLEKIISLTNNIAAALKAERIHVIAPVPGKGSVGIEVPNKVKSMVTLREIIESPEWQTTKAKIPLALGKDVYGNTIIADLAEMPHLLIAGSTGSGKSVCLNAIIASLLFKFSPDELRFIMIDPKVVELQHYNPLPHLVVPVVTDPKKVMLALRWVIQEMEKRYKIFAKVGVRNIESFNTLAEKQSLFYSPSKSRLQTISKAEMAADGFAVQLDEHIVEEEEEEIEIPDRLSYIIVIIDELADLMLLAPADVEMAITRITQMARAAGIHCIIATQRPSVDVITGVIKANIPARIAFQVASKVDSRTILDEMGAEKLLGKGDMLYLPPGSSKPIRAQGAFISDTEIQRLVEFISKQGKPRYEVEIHQALSKSMEEEFDFKKEEDEQLLIKCIEVIRAEQKASVSLLQRRLRLGYTRAARLMDELERRGIVGPSKGAEPRDILVDLDTIELEKLLQSKPKTSQNEAH